MVDDARGDRLRRLCRDYRTLVDRETFALRSQNFDDLLRLLRKKSSLLQALVALGDELDFDPRSCPELCGLVERQRENAVLAAEVRRDLQCALDQLGATSQRARSLRRTYTAPPRAGASARRGVCLSA